MTRTSVPGSEAPQGSEHVIFEARKVFGGFPQIMLADFFKIKFDFRSALNEFGMPECNEWRWKLFGTFLDINHGVRLAECRFYSEEIRRQILLGNPVGAEFLIECDVWDKISEYSFARQANEGVDGLMSYSDFTSGALIERRGVSVRKGGLLYGYGPIRGEYWFKSDDNENVWIPEIEMRRSLSNFGFLECAF